MKGGCIPTAVRDDERLVARGIIRDERRKDEGMTEAGRRQVGQKSEKFHLNWHTIAE
jgi:hypothetical protein